MRLEPVTTCPVCRGQRADDKRDLGAWRTRRCSSCTLEFLDPRPCREDVLSQYTGDDYFVAGTSHHGYSDYDLERPAILATARRRLAMVRRAAPGDEWLEVGPGFGYFLEVARQAGLRMRAVEVSKAAAERVAKLSIPVHLGELETLDARSSFDAIAFFDVLEHLYDPRAFVAAAHRALRRDGVLVFTTPDTDSYSARLAGSRWWSYKIPEHLLYFNRRSLESLLTPHFRLEQARIDAQYLTLGGASRRAARISGRGIATALRRGARVFGEQGMVLVPNGMKLYVARKVGGE